MDVAAHAGPYSDDCGFFVLGKVRPHSVGWRHGGGLCFRDRGAAARPAQIDPDDWNRGDVAVLRAAWDQFLRKWCCRLADSIPTFGRPMECSAYAFADRDFIFQHAQISAFTRLPPDDARAITHPVGTARRRQSSERAQSRLGGIRPGAAFLLCLAHLSASRHCNSGVAGYSPACLARHCNWRFCPETCRLWTRIAVDLRRVDSDGGDLVPALPGVHGISKPASGLGLAQLPIVGLRCRKGKSRMTEA